MNGRKLAETARQHRADLKVLLVTGYDEQAVLGSGVMDAGMGILTKPFNVDAFSEKVLHMLQVPSGGPSVRGVD